MQLKQHQAVILNTGVLLSFEPVGNTHVMIQIDKLVRADGSIRWVRGQEVGPFGNLAIDKNSFESMNPEWKELAAAMVAEAYRAILWLDGFNDGYWEAEITDNTKQAPALQDDAPANEEQEQPQPEPDGGEQNEELSETKKDSATDQSDN